jgi:hypothetical protein
MINTNKTSPERALYLNEVAQPFYRAKPTTTNQALKGRYLLARRQRPSLIMYQTPKHTSPERAKYHSEAATPLATTYTYHGEAMYVYVKSEIECHTHKPMYHNIKDSLF